MKRFLKWFDEDFEETLLMILLVAITVVMMLQVIMRRFFGALDWPEEFCRFCFVYSGFLSMGYCVRRGKMLKVDILLGTFPKAVQRVIEWASDLVTLLFFAYITYYSYFSVMQQVKKGAKSPAMEIPMWIVFLSLLIGSALGTIRQIQVLVRHFLPEKRTEVKD